MIGIIGNTVADGANSKKDDVKLAVPLKYLSNFWRSLEMPLINCKIELSLTWYTNCVTIIGNGKCFWHIVLFLLILSLQHFFKSLQQVY